MKQINKILIVTVFLLTAFFRPDLLADSSQSTELACLKDKFVGKKHQLRRHDIPLEFSGRVSFGDLSGDKNVDFVVSGPNRLIAYDLCGRILWDHNASINWEYRKHKYWYMTSYGYIGDVDSDGEGEFLHIGSDWRTLYIRDGKSGVIEHQFELPDHKWMYVLLGRRKGENGEQASRVFVVTPAFNQDVYINAYDVRSGEPKLEWSFQVPYSKVGNYAYVTPQAANLDGKNGDELLFAGLALDELGQPVWLYNTSSMSVGGMHMLSVRDIDPELEGLEAVISIYGPHKGKPSLVSFANAHRAEENWRSYSPHKERHPHQHTIGDFEPNSPGLEVLARNNNGFNHWMVNAKGDIVRKNWRIDPGWSWHGEYVQAIDWDTTPGVEVLYVERHVGGYRQPRLRIISAVKNSVITPVFTADSDRKPDIPKEWVYNFNPFEAAVHVVDLIGDGREEVLSWGGNRITLFYNSGDASVTINPAII